MSESMIPLAEPVIGGNAARYLKECLDTNFVSSVGPFVSRFEQELAEYVGSPHAVACSSGTAAIHVALQVAGVEEGDEVFVSDFTFVATVNPITYLGAKPVLVDANRATWNIDPELVIGELDRRALKGLPMPKAVLVAHILGLPANIEPLLECCQNHGVVLIEDAAEALGASYRSGKFAGRKTGSIGLLGCYSFNGNKIITTGGGGMIVTSDAKLAERSRHLTTQARIPGPEYRHDEIGYNYRLTNLAAALGVAQLEQLPELLEKKRSIAKRYDSALAGVPGVELPPRVPWSSPSMWLYSILIDAEVTQVDRRQVLEKLDQRGIQVRPVWAPAHLMPFYSDAIRLGTGTGDRLFQQGLSLPCSASLSEHEQARVVEELFTVLAVRTR